MRIAKVTWLDAWFDREQCHPHDIKDTAISIDTVGFVVKENDDVIVVAHEIFEDETVRGYTCIPKGIVTKIVDVTK